MATSQNHSELLKATKKAVNSFVFNPSASKKQSTLEALASLSAFIEAIETPSESESKPKASKSSKKSKTSAKKPKASKSASKTSRKAEIEAILTSGKKLKRAERSVLNKELHALLSEERAALKPSKKAVRRPKRTSANGLELAQAKTATANKVGKAVKTKVVHAITEGDAQPFEPRKEVVVAEPKARKKQQMKLTLLPGESPEEAMARFRSAQLEAARLEAEALIAATCPTSDDLPF